MSLSLRVLSVDDLGYSHRGGALFMSHLRTKESLAGQAGRVPLSALGLEALPDEHPDPLQLLLGGRCGTGDELPADQPLRRGYRC